MNAPNTTQNPFLPDHTVAFEVDVKAASCLAKGLNEAAARWRMRVRGTEDDGTLSSAVLTCGTS
jgi:hypothetical protein